MYKINLSLKPITMNRSSNQEAKKDYFTGLTDELLNLLKLTITDEDCKLMGISNVIECINLIMLPFPRINGSKLLITKSDSIPHTSKIGSGRFRKLREIIDANKLAQTSDDIRIRIEI